MSGYGFRSDYSLPELAVADATADRLEKMGGFEIYRTAETDEKSNRIWITECERDLIVIALRHFVSNPPLSPFPPEKSYP